MLLDVEIAIAIWSRDYFQPRFPIRRCRMWGSSRDGTVFTVLVNVVVGVGHVSAATFQGLGDLAGGTFHSRAMAVSDYGIFVGKPDGRLRFGQASWGW